MTVYAVGDIQGCYQPLLDLLHKIDFKPGQDQLWLCGDLVNRGPDSLSVLRFVYQHRQSIVSVLGNHDLHLLAVAYGMQKLRRSDTLQSILDAPDRELLLSYLAQLPLAHYDQQRDVLMTHAGLPVRWSAHQSLTVAREVGRALRDAPQQFFGHMYGNSPELWRDDLKGPERLRYAVNGLTRMRYVDRQGALELKEKRAPGFQDPSLLPWFDFIEPAETRTSVLFGHWASLAGQTGQPRLQALDTGCVWGNQLTALNLDSFERVSVPGWAGGDKLDD